MKLHVCQSCLQIRQMIVDHCCSGGHASHLNLCKKKIGAVACPYQLSQSPSQKMTANQPEVRLLSPSTSPVTYSLEHSPSIVCSCQSCSDFFRKVQDYLDNSGVPVRCHLMQARAMLRSSDVASTRGRLRVI